MRTLLYTLSAFLFFAFSPDKNQETGKNQIIIFQPKDKEILEQIFKNFRHDTNTPVPELVVEIGKFFKETPYVANTLESETEQLVINLREMDCTTFAENCLALSRTINSGELSFEKFTSELKKIRYRNGKLNGYPSRLHYFSDWIYDNDRKGTIKSVSKEIAGIPYENKVNFMSTHPESYSHLKNNPELISDLTAQENLITNREAYYIPEEKISEFEKKLKQGDIVGLTTGVEGLDITHVGILIRAAGRIHLMHASSKANKVIISEETLEEYLLNSKTVTGIMVARPL